LDGVKRNLMATDAMRLSGTKWLRFSNYELRNSVVWPAPGAVAHEYEPWDLYRALIGKYRTVEPAYLSLLNLSHALKKNPPWILQSHVIEPVIGPKSEGEKLILDWCSRFGLLGIVPTRARVIRLAARVEKRESYSVETSQMSHIQLGGKWFTREDRRRCTGGNIEGFLSSLPKPIVRVWNWWEFDWQDESLSGDLETFFPGEPHVDSWDEPHKYPCPGTGLFARMYGEPVREFMTWAERFAEAARLLSQRTPSSAIDKPNLGAVNEALYFLEGLANLVQRDFHFPLGERKIVETQAAPSLLASFALMVLYDLREGRKILDCENCQKVFISNDPRARYCSPTCRHTAQSRRHRERKKPAEVARND
jgi:hypothetical protein